MIANDDLDRFSKDFAAEILYSHARDVDRGPAPEISIGAGLIVENTNAYHAAGALCIRDAIEK
jgi:hypothetical protein